MSCARNSWFSWVRAVMVASIRSILWFIVLRSALSSTVVCCVPILPSLTFGVAADVFHYLVDIASCSDQGLRANFFFFRSAQRYSEEFGVCNGAVLYFSGKAGGMVLGDALDFFGCGGFCWFVNPPGGGFLQLDLLFDPFCSWW